VQAEPLDAQMPYLSSISRIASPSMYSKLVAVDSAVEAGLEDSFFEFVSQAFYLCVLFFEVFSGKFTCLAKGHNPRDVFSACA